MKVNIIKPGKWAESGKFVHDLKKGEQDIKTSFALELISLGAAKEVVIEVEEPEVEKTESETLDAEPSPEPEIEGEPSSRKDKKNKKVK